MSLKTTVHTQRVQSEHKTNLHKFSHKRISEAEHGFYVINTIIIVLLGVGYDLQPEKPA